MSVYPGVLDSFVAKTDGLTQIIYAAHVNALQQAVVAIETELGTDPAGSLADLKTRLAVRIANDGKLKQPQQLVTVGKTNSDYTTITAALASISDAAANKIYTVLVFPGQYNEGIILKDYVDIVAIDPNSTTILQTVHDNAVEVHSYLKIDISVTAGSALQITGDASVITVDGDLSSTASYAIYTEIGTVTINGNLSSTADNCIYMADGTITVNGNITTTVAQALYMEAGTCTINGDASASANYAIYADGGTTIVKNGTITSTLNTNAGHGARVGSGTLILQNVKIICTHADAKSIYASVAKNCRSLAVWANRDDHANITQLIPGGFTFDADVQ